MKVQPPSRFSVWLSNHVRLVWAGVAANLFVYFLIAMFLGGLWDIWYIVGAVFLANYLYFMRLFMRQFREVKSDVEWIAARDERQDSK